MPSTCGILKKTTFDSKMCPGSQDPGHLQHKLCCNHTVHVVNVIDISRIRGKKVN